MNRERWKFLSVFIVAILFTAAFTSVFWLVEGSTRNMVRVAVWSFPSGIIFGIVFAAIVFRKRAGRPGGATRKRP